MPVRPLALAALLILAPAPVAAHAAETTPPPAPAAESPADVPPSAAPGDEEPAGGAAPRPGTGPADPPATAPAPGSGGISAPEDGSTPLPDEQPSPAPGGGPAPEPADARATAAPGTPPDGNAGPDADADAEELTGLVHTSVVGATAPAAHHPGSGALLRPQGVARAQLLPAQQRVTPGTLTRIPPGTVTRIPVQDRAAGSSATAWVVGLSAVGAAAVAAAVARRARRSSAGA